MNDIIYVCPDCGKDMIWHDSPRGYVCKCAVRASIPAGAKKRDSEPKSRPRRRLRFRAGKSKTKAAVEDM